MLCLLFYIIVISSSLTSIIDIVSIIISDTHSALPAKECNNCIASNFALFV